MNHRHTAALVGALAVIVPAGSAEAASRTVTMGPPPAAGKALERYNVTPNAFFPRTVTVGAGDTVAFEAYGFHTVEFVRKGGTPTKLFTPTGTASGQSDAAGQPFWFAPQQVLGFNPALLRSNFGKTRTHSRTATLNSGLPLGDKLEPFKVRFPKAGTYSYLCTLHPDMKGTVKVRSRGRAQSARSVKRAVDRQVGAVRKAAPGLAKSKAPQNTVLLGAAKRAGGGALDYFAMVPSKLTVPVGTTVEFRMPAQSDEVHSATFGPGDERDPASYLGSIAKSFESPVFDARGMYPSEPAGTQATLTPSLHGNGFWNSGVLTAAADVQDLGSAGSAKRVTFGAPGTYSFLCVIHPFMKGEVVVQ